MTEELCEICGAPATRTSFVGGAVCDNVVCQQALLDKVNGELQEATYESWDETEEVV